MNTAEISANGGASAEPELVLFTGGRDSTLAACTLMLRHVPVVLFTGNSGMSLGRELSQYRVTELRARFGSLVRDHVLADTSGTIRSLALETIESDILRFRKNLVLLGEKLSIHVHAIVYCLQRGITAMNDGVVSYQAEFPEQKLTACRFLESFTGSYGIAYRSPIYALDSEAAVKRHLMQLGLSTKSLEGTTLFADSFSEADEATVIAYLAEKEPAARRIVEFLRTGRLGVSPRPDAWHQRAGEPGVGAPFRQSTDGA